MSNKPRMITLAGIPTARGLVSGPVFLYRGEGALVVPEYEIEPGREGDELLRFKRAFFETKRDLEGMVAVLKARSGRDDVQVFECHLMMLEDPLLSGQIERLIIDRRINAESAVKSVVAAERAKFERMNDSYFRERVRDLDDIERRLLRRIIGFSGSPYQDLKRPSIVVADDLTPSETIQLPREFVLGFATNGGSATSHVALLARAMGIPAVTGLGGVTERARPGQEILLDGTSGAVTFDPDAPTRANFENLVRRDRELVNAAKDGRPAGALADGGSVLIYANVHPGVSAEGLREIGARGVGLYRSEYLWLNREGEPSEEEQFIAYRDAAQFASMLSDEATLTIRALDIGGDKLVRGISKKEQNPFLGNRSIRYLLSTPDVFRTQLRAILRASHYGRVCLMYPLVSCVDELMEAATILEDVKMHLEADDIPYDRKMPIGAMIEVPAAALNADALAKYVDFFSLGTNDLVQYTMAADRGNEAVSHLYQPLNPAVVELVRRTIDAARRNGIRVGVCGESAADPVVGTLWAAMGAEMLSMSATYIPVMSRLLSRMTSADLAAYRAFADSCDKCLTAREIYDACRRWLVEKVPDIAEFMT